MEFSMLLVNSNRSKAYLQNLIRLGYKPNKVIVLEEEFNKNNDKAGKSSTSVSIKKIDGIDLFFDEKEHILQTLEKVAIDYVLIHTLNVNSSEVANEIKKIKEKYLIYSGPGGAIVSEQILSLGKEFIHVHSGWLPEYRGSTTMYYSLIIDSNICCSVIALNSGIDTGDILFRKKYDLPKLKADYDYVVDPILRTDTLINYLKNKMENKIEKNTVQQFDKGNTFYIIHPVLKNIAILKNSGELSFK